MTDSKRQHLRHALREALPLPAGMEPKLKAALEQVLNTPGNLIRPEIVLAVANAYGMAPGRATDLALALEFFHTSSLLFDDLPAMDDATERRGVPCVHVHFDEATAMLAALALINRAYALSWSALSACSATTREAGSAYLERYLGIHGLLNGQSRDLHYADLPHDLKSTEAVAIGKTVALIRLTLVLPALIADAPTAELQLLDRIALFWGLSYQIVDDLKDVLQTSSVTGKTAARDLSLNRPNIALVLGVERATGRLARMIRIGDKLANRLIALRPAMNFLTSLRADLGEQAAAMAEPALTGAGGGRR